MIATKEYYLCLRFLCFQSIWSYIFLGSAGCDDAVVSSFPAGCIIHSPNIEQISADFLILLEEVQFGSDFCADKAIVVLWYMLFYSDILEKGLWVVLRAVLIFQTLPQN